MKTNSILAYQQGEKDFLKGKSVIQNPYPVGSMNNSHWRTGWRNAESKKTI